jgi:hypothetical protein
VWRSAWLRGARAEPWAWRGRRQVALGGFRGHAPGVLAQKCHLFFLSALRTIIFLWWSQLERVLATPYLVRGRTSCAKQPRSASA